MELETQASIRLLPSVCDVYSLSLHLPLSALRALVQSGSQPVWGFGSWPSGSPDGWVALTAVSRWQH